MNAIVASIPWQSGLVCSGCMEDIREDPALPPYANRDGEVFCPSCAPGAGRPVAGFDCETCQNRDCGHVRGQRGCGHFLCQAFTDRAGIIRQDCGSLYASCPGAPREVVAVQSFAQAIKFRFAWLLSPGARSRLFGENGEAS